MANRAVFVYTLSAAASDHLLFSIYIRIDVCAVNKFNFKKIGVFYQRNNGIYFHIRQKFVEECNFNDRVIFYKLIITVLYLLSL